MIVNIVNNSVNELPTYANEGDAGMDLRADFSSGVNSKLLFGADFDSEKVVIYPGGRALIPTNLSTAIPVGYEVQIRPRSGVALKSGVTVLNTPGTIDANYRNTWGVVLINLSDDDFVVFQGDRIAQAVLNKFETIEWNLVTSLDETERGLGGFGSSGVK